MTISGKPLPALSREVREGPRQKWKSTIKGLRRDKALSYRRCINPSVCRSNAFQLGLFKMRFFLIRFLPKYGESSRLKGFRFLSANSLKGLDRDGE